VEALRAEVRQSMNRELDDLIRNRLRSQVLEALYGANKFDLPKALIEEQIQQLQLDMARRANIQDPNQLPPAATFEEMAARYPHIVEIVMAATRGDPSAVGRGCDEQFEFEFALDLLLDGFERLRDQGWTSRPGPAAALPAAEPGA